MNRKNARHRISAVAFPLVVALTLAPAPTVLSAQEARTRWERMCQIRAEKFDLILPKAMHDNDLDMWIVVMREGLLDPLWEALGRGYVGDWAYYVFTDGGERVERAAPSCRAPRPGSPSTIPASCSATGCGRGCGFTTASGRS